jgi:glycosyltransferase involved in cell wall biosynthesis
MVPASKSKIQLSVAVVTMNRPDSLNLALESLRTQSCQPSEVIVSDDSDPSYQAAVKKVAEHWHCQYIVGPSLGLYANRNHGALACAGTHIRTMDDDHQLPPGHLQTCLDAVESDPGAIWTTGERGFVDGQYYMTLETATQLHPSGVGEAVSNLDDNWAIADGSTIYPAEIFHRGYKMVDWYGYGPSYLEFGAYLYKHGFKSRCIRGAIIDHYAQAATLSRLLDVDKESEEIESRLFASLCFNLYFRPNRFLAFKSLLACLKQSGCSPRLLGHLPLVLSRVRQRWRD